MFISIRMSRVGARLVATMVALLMAEAAWSDGRVRDVAGTKATTDTPVAFPGAEGFGKYTTGGRGGAVIEVTNVNDTGVGSLRAAVAAKGPRTIVFRVSGTITLNSDLKITNPYITIAGQTAPGDGICIRKFPVVVSAGQVIIRYLRIRLGDESGGESDALWGRWQSNVIIDHCSTSWSEDETLSMYWYDSLTVQWCFLTESLYNSNHPKGAHGYGGIWGGANSSYHHNLLAHHSSRNPRFASGSGNTDFRNNVIFNWGFNSAYGGEAHDTTWASPLSTINMVANYYKPGPATKSGVVYRIINPSTRNGLADYGFWYVAENYVVGSAAATADNWTYGVQGPSVSDKAQIRANTPFTYEPITQQTAEEAYPLVLTQAGATRPRRDSVDVRIVSEVQKGTATYEGATYRVNQGFPSTAPKTGIIDSQNDVGGWPVLTSATPPADTDHDGMPDTWEAAHGLISTDPSDRNNIGAGGYTNLELYLNSPELLTGAVEPDEVPERFTLYQNYPNPFNPRSVIRYQTIDFRYLKVAVYDLMGQEVATLTEGRESPGEHTVRFDGSGLASGVYLYRLTAGGTRITKKMLLLK
jgi:pectate lyase